MTVAGRSAVARYIANSDQYWDNALLFLRKRETGKASEFLWGSVAQAVKAIAASRGKRLRMHVQIRGYVELLSRELQDSSILEGFAAVESLHSNFYEVELDSRYIASLVGLVQSLRKRLLSLIPAS